jgi:phi13 family phage major tail protein
MAEEAKKIVRTRRRGLKDVHVGRVITNDNTTYAVQDIVKLGKAISAKISDKFSVEKIYGDDAVEEVASTYEGSDIELELNTLAPQDRVIILGNLYKYGYLIKSSEDEAPEIAIGWRAKKGNGKYEFVWYYCGKFPEGIDDDYQTQEDKLKTQTNKLKGQFYARQKEDTIDSKKKHLYSIVVDEENLAAEDKDAAAAIQDWFSKVQEYKEGQVVTG